MKPVFRIVEDQAKLSSYKATYDLERAVQLEMLIELTKPKNKFSEWHYLISSPFRYSPPFMNARFRPPFAQHNVFYAAFFKETAMYEHAFHFMRERLHLLENVEIGQRTLFGVNADTKHAIYISKLPHADKILHKKDYSFSQSYVAENPQHKFFIYPSLRDPKHRDNAAILNINNLDKTILEECAINFFYDFQTQQLTWIDENIVIYWNDVA